MVHKNKLKIRGYLVCCPRQPDGVFCKTMPEAEREMDRMMRKGASQAGISEMY